MDFQDIAIVGIDEQRTHLVGTGQYEIYYKLSAKPPRGWAEIYQRVERDSYGLSYAPFRVEGACIVAGGTTDQASGDFLTRIRIQVQQTNERYRQSIAVAEAQAEAARIQAKKVEDEEAVKKRALNEEIKRRLET